MSISFQGTDASPHPDAAINQVAVINSASGSAVSASEFGPAQEVASFVEGALHATISATQNGELRAYTLSSNAELRDNFPADHQVDFREAADQARIRTGNLMFDGLYALAVHEAQQNSVAHIKDDAYNNNKPFEIKAFETGQAWHYVWTRDLAYATHLGLASFDPERAAQTLLFKASKLKASVSGGFANQIVQDTGSGGSYPVSTDRIVWAMGVAELLKWLPATQRANFLGQIYPFLRDTLEQDRRLVFDESDGLYRGEQSFLDWREQTYPGWTKDNVLPIALSKALSVNAANYFALDFAASCAQELGHADEQIRYAHWALELKTAISARFYDVDSGFYSTYLLCDGAQTVRARRYDLLGQSLAILFGLSSREQAQKIIENTPVGRYGPPVVWPQERSVPIYHNHGMWPFVTAYWIKAARMVGNAQAVDRGIHSLVRGAALNLSNMENLDLATGRGWARSNGLEGPVINSQRQIWSVAGYLSMVQDVIFGLETSQSGIRFRPFVTGEFRNRTCAASNSMELRDFHFQGKKIQVRVQLPHGKIVGQGACRIARILLNGHPIGDDFVAATALEAHNVWDVFLDAPDRAQSDSGVRALDVGDARALFSPLQPEWQGEGIRVENGLLSLSFSHPDAAHLAFNVYRDGELRAENLKTLRWIDPDSGDYASKTHLYRVEATDIQTGNVSHPTPSRFYAAPGLEQSIGAAQMRNRGGQLVGDSFKNWGGTNDTLEADFWVERAGRYCLRAYYANGAGTIGSGIACAVKRLEILAADSLLPIASSYLVMPQTADWTRFTLSSPLYANLQIGQEYRLCITEDAFSRNMSFLEHNTRYTAHAGGGDQPSNFVNIAQVQLLIVN